LKNYNIHTLERLDSVCQHCDAGYCKYEDGTPLYQEPVRLFEEMVENMKCKVMCDQLTAKTFTNHHNAVVGI